VLQSDSITKRILASIDGRERRKKDMTTRIAIIGGFLGAGKTTLITKLAKKLTAEGKRVGLIMNDQGEALVDTNYTCGMGLEVEEVLRGCFCCRFPDFMHSARTLVGKKNPEVILAEPVGSCTDLLATVVAPLKIVYPKEFSVAPLLIMVDCTRVLKDGIEADSIGGVLRTHQIEEAEYVVLSKVDMIKKAELKRLREAIKVVNPDCRIIPYSAITDQGLDQIYKVITSRKDSARSPKPIDYDVYARAEAELGWYNGRYIFKAMERYDSYALANQLLRQIATQYGPEDIAHAKVMVRSESNAVKMSLVLGNITVDAVKGSRYGTGGTELIVNARIVSEPEKLREAVREAVDFAMASVRLKVDQSEDDCFAPSPPRPYYRMTSKESETRP
jgi:G3E family GTPase